MKILLQGERNSPLIETVIRDGLVPMPPYPDIVEGHLIVKLIWNLGVKALSDFLLRGGTIDGTGALIVSPHAKGRQRSAATAAQVAGLLAAPVVTKVRRPRRARKAS